MLLDQWVIRVFIRAEIQNYFVSFDNWTSCYFVFGQSVVRLFGFLNPGSFLKRCIGKFNPNQEIITEMKHKSSYKRPHSEILKQQPYQTTWCMPTINRIQIMKDSSNNDYLSLERCSSKETSEGLRSKDDWKHLSIVNAWIFLRNN